VRELGIRPLIARRNTERGSGLGTQRWVVERAFALLHHFRRLRIRWEIRGNMHEALLRTALAPETRARARAVAGTIRTDGATVAAKLLLDAVSRERPPVSA
jgi:transposase